MSTKAKVKASRKEAGRVKLSITFKTDPQAKLFLKVLQTYYVRQAEASGIHVDTMKELDEEVIVEAFHALEKAIDTTP